MAELREQLVVQIDDDYPQGWREPFETEAPQAGPEAGPEEQR